MSGRIQSIISSVVACVAIVCVVAGCANQGEKIEQYPVEKTTQQDMQQDATQSDMIETPAQQLERQGTTISMQPVVVEPQCKPAMGFTFELPEDWTYEVICSDDEPTSTLSAMIRPGSKSGELRSGNIVIECMEGFGVCGTGLEQKEIVINGKEAWQGFYDENPVWSFIVLKNDGEGQSCVIMNSAEWYQDYADVVAAILETIEFKMYE